MQISMQEQENQFEIMKTEWKYLVFRWEFYTFLENPKQTNLDLTKFWSMMSPKLTENFLHLKMKHFCKIGSKANNVIIIFYHTANHLRSDVSTLDGIVIVTFCFLNFLSGSLEPSGYGTNTPSFPLGNKLCLAVPI